MKDWLIKMFGGQKKSDLRALELVITQAALSESGGAARRMAKALSTFSTQLRQQTRNEPGLDGIGSTVVCALVRGGKALIAHMGDSPGYRLWAGQLKQLTKDHTLIWLLIDSGDITPEAATTHPAFGRLTRNVGMAGEPLPQTRLLKLKPCDRFLLCTDGLTGMLGDPQIASILNEPSTMETQCQRLVDAAKEAGGNDNVTVLLVAVEGRERKTDSNARHAESIRVPCSNTVDGKTNEQDRSI